MRSQNGLTFIELAVVLLIIGLMAAIALPNFVGMLRAAKTGSVARNMAGYMKYLQDKAVRDNTEYIVVFYRDSESGRYTYWAAKEVPEEEMPPEYYYSSEFERMQMRYPEYRDEFVKAVELPSGITIPVLLDEEENRVRDRYYMLTFYPDGTATRTTIYIQGADKRDFIIVYVKQFTGEAVLYEDLEEYKQRNRLPDDLREE